MTSKSKFLDLDKFASAVKYIKGNLWLPIFEFSDSGSKIGISDSGQWLLSTHKGVQRIEGAFNTAWLLLFTLQPEDIKRKLDQIESDAGSQISLWSSLPFEAILAEGIDMETDGYLLEVIAWIEFDPSILTERILKRFSRYEEDKKFSQSVRHGLRKIRNLSGYDKTH